MRPSRKATEPVAEGEIGRASAPPVKTAVTLSAEAHYRLKCACVHHRKDQSELVEEIILEKFAAYHTRARKATAGEDATAA